MEMPEVVGLGEMMNDPGVLAADTNTLREINETLKAGKTVTGHFTIPDTISLSMPILPLAYQTAMNQFLQKT